MSLLLLYVACDSSFISTQFLVLNLDGWFVVSSNNFFWYSIITYYHINLWSLIIFCLFLIYVFVCISIFLSIMCNIFFWIVLLRNFWDLCNSFSIFFAIKSPVAFAVFAIVFIHGVLSASVTDCFAWSDVSGCIGSLGFCVYFYQYFFLISSKR